MASPLSREERLAYQREWARRAREKCKAHGPDGDCSQCRKARRQREQYNADVRANKLAAVCRRHGITVEQYEAMHEQQGGVCAICHQPETAFGYAGGREERRVKRLAIDHCHDSGRVRGLLCNNCNRAIGLLKDDVSVLASAIDYLGAS